MLTRQGRAPRSKTHTASHTEDPGLSQAWRLWALLFEWDCRHFRGPPVCTCISCLEPWCTTSRCQWSPCRLKLAAKMVSRLCIQRVAGEPRMQTTVLLVVGSTFYAQTNTHTVQVFKIECANKGTWLSLHGCGADVQSDPRSSTRDSKLSWIQSSGQGLDAVGKHLGCPKCSNEKRGLGQRFWR